MAQSNLKRFFGAAMAASEVQPSKRLLSSVPSSARNAEPAEEAVTVDSEQATSSEVIAEMIEKKKLAALERKAAAEVARFADLDAALPGCWGLQLKSMLAKPFWQQLKNSLQDQQTSGKTIFPPPSKVFSALHLTHLTDVRAVIVGQDP